MTANSPRESAKIIQFPTGGRAALGRHTATNQTEDFATTRVAKVASGGAWYHDEAIRDAGDDHSK
ncbi:DUF2735 domain-containing protein [Methyloligella sp. 2.7D]|uniref:DUF2735 domain-containing protein n=1 Tax=unclassified Methyloligella TaxID=2625955 RepID=UPI00157C38AB|nr:DUF2735 domain-containing protein [Methyloligella sp. GL2]QKP77181.1 DUF2735 domain-containing protein [Methyloligella sp. GL2]